MSKPLKTKAGLLTRYGLACGYKEMRDLRGYKDASVEIFQDGTLHVRAFDYHNHRRLMWETPSNLKDARTIYNNAEKLIRLK